MDRLFLDSCVLFSAAYRPGAKFLPLWNLSATELITSRYALDEVRRNLATAAQFAALEGLLDGIRIVPDSDAAPPGVQLPRKDIPIMAAAIAARATHLLTSDKIHFGPYAGMRIGGVLIAHPADYLSHRP